MDFQTISAKLGEYRDGGDLPWFLFADGHRKLALIGNDEKIRKIRYNIDKSVEIINGIPYLKVNFDDADLESKGSITKITSFEKEPVDSIANQFLAAHRKDFVKMYINLLTDLIGLDRRVLQVGYRPTIEGPLYGYIRAFNKLEGNVKESLNAHIQSLDNIEWENKDLLYIYKVKEGDPHQRFLDFFTAVWSVWVFCMIMPADLPKVVHINIPDTSSFTDVMKEYLDRLIEIVEEVSNMSYTALIVSTDNVDSIVRSSIRYKLFTSNTGRDYNLENFNLSFEENDQSFMMLDDVYKRKYIGRV